MTAIVTQGNAMSLYLPDDCVDLLITSPPYFGLRSYQDNGAHYEGQVGDEATPAEYLDALIACTAEWVRVLKPGGSIFVNLGDKYSGAQARTNTGLEAWSAENGRGGAHTVAKAAPPRHKTDSARVWQQTDPRRTGIPAKSLMMLPWRYAIRCVDELGLILRAEIIWAKPNGLPESVTDRVRRSHEQVFHFVTQPRYYTAVDDVREQHTGGAHSSGNGPSRQWIAANGLATNHRSVATDPKDYNPLGKLPGSVWEIATAPLSVPEHVGVDHFAAYPPELVRRIMAGWSPRAVCTACGEGRRPVVDKGEHRMAGHGGNYAATPYDPDGYASGVKHGHGSSSLRTIADRIITGYACGCPDTTAPTTPGVILDPFGGTGTTALVASVLGRVGISVDLSADYCRLARWRTTDPGERARALGVPKPPPQVDGQLGMFDGLGA